MYYSSNTSVGKIALPQKYLSCTLKLHSGNAVKV